MTYTPDWTEDDITKKHLDDMDRPRCMSCDVYIEDEEEEYCFDCKVNNAEAQCEGER